MRIQRLAIPAFALLALGACSSSDDNSGGSLSTAERVQLASKLSNLSSTFSAAGNEEASIGAAFASFGIIAGAKINTVTLTAGTLAGMQKNGMQVLSTRGANAGIAAGSYSVVGVQWHLNGAPSGEPADMSGLVAWHETDGEPTDFVVGFGENSGSGSFNVSDAAATAFGALFQNPNKTWIATAGSVSLSKTGTGGNCAYWTEEYEAYGDCNTATFTGSLNISASQPGPNSGNTATGNATASIPSSTIGGVYFVFDYDSAPLSTRRSK